MAWWTNPVANLVQWHGNVSNAIGDTRAGNRSQAAAAAIRDPNQVYTGSLNPFAPNALLGDLADGKSSFKTVATSTGSDPDSPRGNDTPSGGGTDNGGGTGYGGGYSTPRIDQTAIDALMAQKNMTQGAYDRLDGSKQTAFTNLLNQYNAQNAKADNNYNRSKSDHETGVARTTSQFAGEKERIADNVRQNVSSLQRLLASRGAGSSSASQIMAPYAAARAGTSERAEAGNTFSENMFEANKAWNRFDEDHKQAKKDFAADYENRRRAAESGIEGKRAELLQQLNQIDAEIARARGGGSVDYASRNSQINQLLDRIAQLEAQVTGQVLPTKDVAYNAADMKDMTVDTRGVEGGSQDPTYDETGAFYPVREDEEDKFLQSLYQ